MENNDNGKETYSSEPSLCSDESSSEDFGGSLDPLFDMTTCEKLNTQLIESIPDGDIKQMKRVLAMGANPNASCRLHHVSACHIAAMFDNDALDLLLSSGADSSRFDQLGRTPLHLAAWAGNAKHIAVLLNFPEALRKSVAEQVVLSPETVAEVRRHSLSVNKLTNLPCRPYVKSTLPGYWSDGVEHNCDSIKEMLPEIEQNWTALHVASARAQHHCVQLLLAAGADANAQDADRTPLDVAGWAHYFGHKIDDNNFMKTVDLLLKAGGNFQRCHNRWDCANTTLHTAVRLRSEAAVKQMLQAGASAFMLDRCGLTAMHLCVEIKDRELLQLLVNHKSSNEGSNLPSIDVVDRWGRTVLEMAVNEGWLQGVCVAVAAGAVNVRAVPTLDVERTVFHVAANLRNNDVLEHLLNYYDNAVVKKHINTSDYYGTPLLYAISKNDVNLVRMLIFKGGAEVDRDSHNRCLDIAVKNSNIEIAEMIIERDVETVHAVNGEGRSPLYEACSHGHREMIALLLRHGADLSGGVNNNGRKFVPLKVLMNNFSKPTEFLQDIFDSNINSCLQREDYEKVFVNFQVLSPINHRKKMRVIQALLNTGNIHDQQKLLLHPLVESFLFLQWKSLLPFFYIMLALHVCFVLSLNVFVLSLFWYTDRKIELVPIVFRSGIWIYIIYITAFLLTVQDVIITQMKTIRFRLSLETSVKCLSTVLAVVLPQVVSWNSKSNPEWVRLFVSVTLLLAWVRMMYLLSRLPDCGYYVLMYGRVATKVFKILVSFGFLIVGFSVSFMIQFHAQQPFEDPWSSLLTTMVMMTSELGYNEIINKKSVEHASASLIMIRLVFLSFLVLVSIILMNLLVGVAVNDVNTLEIIGNINRLKKQVQFIKSFEDTACYRFVANILPANLYKRWFEFNVPRNFYVRKGQTKKENHGLPTRLIEAIFENVQLQKGKSYEKLGSKLYQTKMDEIHKVIVKKDSGLTAKPEIPDNARLLEEIIKLRADMELQIKNHIGKIADALNVVISNSNQR